MSGNMRTILLFFVSIAALFAASCRFENDKPAYSKVGKSLDTDGGSADTGYVGPINPETGVWKNLLKGKMQPRYSSAMVFDIDRAATYLFGGYPLDDEGLWEWDGNIWSKIDTINTPSPRWGHSLVYDPKRKKVILYGGTNGSNYYSDLWEYNPETKIWLDRTPSIKPAWRDYAGLVYSQYDEKVYLFGGMNGNGYLDDMWAWNCSTGLWEAVEPSTPDVPKARRSHSMVYLPANKTIFLYGGVGVGTNFFDSWSFSVETKTWSFVSGLSYWPESSYGHTAVIDESSGGVLLFGGKISSISYNDTWEYFNSVWNKLNASNEKPSSRVYHSSVYDSSINKMTIYGGYDQKTGIFSLGTWELNRETMSWENKTKNLDEVIPCPRNQHKMAYDIVQKKVLMVGGYGLGKTRGDVWYFSEGSKLWNAYQDEYLPSPRYNHAVIYIPDKKKLILFGGYQSSSVYANDTWVMDSTTGKWTLENPTDKPDPRQYHTMAYDQKTGIVFLYGGQTKDGVTLNDTWQLNIDEMTWSRIQTTSQPQYGVGYGMVYDGGNEQILLFGREGLWKMDGTAWINIEPSGIKPSNRSQVRLYYDSFRKAVILFGGYDSTKACSKGVTPLCDDIWEYKDGKWIALGLMEPSRYYLTDLAFDSDSRKFILFGGQLNATSDMQETWEYFVYGGDCVSGDDCDTFHCVNNTCCLDAACEAVTECVESSYCDPVTGHCKTSYKNDQTSCSFGDNCSTGDHCDGSGGCVEGSRYSCVPTQCQKSSICDGVGGCTVVNKDAGDGCNDQNPCTFDDKCDLNGNCKGIPYECKGDNVCVRGGVCDGLGGCVWDYWEEGTDCNNGEDCDHSDKCDGKGKCQGEFPYECNVRQCDATAKCKGDQGCERTFKPITESCNDGNLCTKEDHCDGSGGCTGTYYNCPEPNQCQTKLTCDGLGGCIPTNKTKGEKCDDGSFCSYDDACDGFGKCEGKTYSCPMKTQCQESVSCDGKGSCTVVNASIITTCKTGITCSIDDHCDGMGNCVSGGIEPGCTFDAGTDSGLDSGQDSAYPPDSSTDAETDTGVDAAFTDTGSDSGPDSSHPQDASHDAGLDSGDPDGGAPDTGVDSGADGGHHEKLPYGCSCATVEI